MKSYLKYITLLISFLCNQNLADGLVALVGSSPITQSEVLQGAQMQLMQTGRSNFSSEKELDYYFKQSLENIINQKVLFEQAKLDTEIVVTNDDVKSYLENHIQNLINQHGSVDILENVLGQTVRSFERESWDDVYKLIVAERYQQKLLSGVAVSRKEVVEFFNVNKDSLGMIPAQTKYSIIEVPVVPGKQVEIETINFLNSIRDSVLRGGDFSVYATRYSQDPGTVETGGDLGFIKRGTLVSEYERVGFSLKEKEISGPVKTEFGYHLIQLISRQGEKIWTKHILRQLVPSEKDKNTALDSLKYLYSIIQTNPLIFDSIALNLQGLDNSISSVFDWTYNSNISDNILSEIDFLSSENISYPFETDNGYAVLKIYGKKEVAEPTIQNSWNLLNELALQNKIYNTMNSWLKVIKSDTYIKYYY